MLATAPDAANAEHRQEREGLTFTTGVSPSAAALNLLRPAQIPASVNLLESVWFDPAQFKGPNRHNLVDAVAVLNALGALTDAEVDALSRGPVDELSLWGRIEWGFTTHFAEASVPVALDVGSMLTEALPIKSIVGHWLAWHELSATVVSDKQLSEIVHLTDASHPMYWHFPGLFSSTQARVVGHLNRLTQTPGNELANALPLAFSHEAVDAASFSVAVGCDDMTGLDFSAWSTGFSPDYWRGVVNSLHLIGLHLRPLITPDDMIECHPIQMEEDSEDVRAVLDILANNGDDQSDVEAVEAAIEQIESFSSDCFDSFERALEGVDIEEGIRRRWLSGESKLDIAGFRSFVERLPAPQTSHDHQVKDWLAAVAGALPASETDSILACVREVANVEGWLDALLPVYFADDDDFAEACLQPAYECFMSGGDEDFQWSFDWNVSPALLEGLATSIGAGNRLLADLEHRLSCTAANA